MNETLVLDKVLERVKKMGSDYWYTKLFGLQNSHIHVAVMVEPYLTKILNGEKTVESRFSKKRSVPWKKIDKGDAIILKKSGGEFVGIFEVEEVIYKELKTSDDIDMIKKKYNDKLCVENDFWERKKDSKYVTLISISHLLQFDPIKLSDRNRQAWITFGTYNTNLSLHKYVKEIGTVYCISGEIGSGKTTIGTALSKKINGKHYSVSDFLKKELRDKGCNTPSREQLQEIGTEYIDKGWNYFCSCILEYINWDGKSPLIIDGVRHIEFLNTLKLLCYPAPVYEIYLKASDETLKEHISKRNVENYNSRHTSEGNQKLLCDTADICIDVNKKRVEKIVEEIQKGLSMYCKEERISDSTVAMDMLKQHIDYFNLLRDWKKYHNARDLAISINLEAAELLEIFQWNSAQENMDTVKMERIKEELADVLIYSINLANAYGFDITELILNKLKINELKYPVSK